jgi:hypothetical protein
MRRLGKLTKHLHNEDRPLTTEASGASAEDCLDRKKANVRS